MAGNNVLAQVPDLDDFLGGFAIVLPPEGVLTLEFPHLLRLLEGRQFDTIYHEHFSYFSLRTVQRLLEPHGLAVTDVAELPTHGGSLRVTIRHAGMAEPGERVAKVLGDAATAGLETLAPYAAFAASAEAVKRDLLAFLIEAKRGGKRVVGYGAPGKANTLLNWCGIRTDLVAFTVDRNPYKHGRFTPGTRIPILPPERLADARPDYVWSLPWNRSPEIQVQLAGIGEWGGRFVTAIPSLTVGAPGRAAVA